MEMYTKTARKTRQAFADFATFWNLFVVSSRLEQNGKHFGKQEDKWFPERMGKLMMSGLPLGHCRYPRQEVQRMYIALKNLSKKVANPQALP